jgi:hypothetical protein
MEAHMRWSTSAILAGLVLSGCGTQVASGTASIAVSTPSVVTPSQPTNQTVAVATDCPPDAGSLELTGEQGQTPPLLAADVTVVAAIECSIDSRPIPGDGLWSFKIEKRVDAGPAVNRLVAALRSGDEPSTGQMCAGVGVVIPWFALVDDHGVIVRPRMPVDACGGPKGVAMEALQAMPWIKVNETKDAQVETQAQVDRDAAATSVNCSTDWKDMISIGEAAEPPSSGSGQWSNVAADGASLCHYSASGDSGGMPMLSFLSGTKLSGDVATKISAQLAATTQVQPCQLKHTSVALLFLASGNYYLIEEDGCHRIVDGNNSVWGQASPDLMSAIG